MILGLSKKTLAILGAALVIAVGAIVYQSSGCTTVTDVTPERGSHGYRVWSNDVFKSFTHRGQDICVPEGWFTVGAVSEGEGTAKYERGKTGILVRKDAFGLRVLEPTNSSFRVNVYYPLTLPRADVEKLFTLVAGTFSNVGAWYGDKVVADRKPHSVIVTTGLLPDEQVYPDPSERVTSLIASPKAERGEGLLIHAVVHLYNRFSGELGYQGAQWPFNAGEFQELEATWAETGLSTHPEAGFTRLNYLYRVHSALVAQKPELVTDPPFNDAEAFNAITPTILVKPGSPYLDFQYGHYVLAPLTMVAIDTLLTDRATGLSVYSILKDIHTGKRTGFMEAVSAVLPDKDMKQINAWIIADAQIPVSLIQRAIARYDQ